MQLRSYQQAVVREVEAQFAAGERRLCVQVPTGGGKTVLAAEIVRRFNRRVLYVVPSVEILGQTAAKLRAAGIVPELLQAGQWPRLHRQRVVLAMAQTLQRRQALLTSSPWYPDLVIVDEAHRMLDAHQDTLSAFPSPSIALTATPVRLDGRSLASVWPMLIQGPSVRSLQAAGALCPLVTVDWPIGDLRGLKVRMGDYDQAALERRLLEHHAPARAAEAWQARLRGRRSIAFCPGRELSMGLVEALGAAGARAVHVDGRTAESTRARALAALARGELDVVSNCGLFVEGLDVPSVSGVILATSTQSLTRYLQMVGRGLRVAAGKTDLVLVDHGRCAARLGPADADRDWSRGGAPTR